MFPLGPDLGSIGRGVVLVLTTYTELPGTFLKALRCMNLGIYTRISIIISHEPETYHQYHHARWNQETCHPCRPPSHLLLKFHFSGLQVELSDVPSQFYQRQRKRLKGESGVRIIPHAWIPVFCAVNIFQGTRVSSCTILTTCISYRQNTEFQEFEHQPLKRQSR